MGLNLPQKINKKQPLSCPSDIKRFFVTPEQSGQICLLATFLGETGNIFFPKLDFHKDQIYLKIKRAKTDQYPIPDNIDDLDNRPEALNLINIYASFSNKSVKEILQQFSGKGFSQFKESLSDLIINDISPITKEMKHLMNNKDEIIKIEAYDNSHTFGKHPIGVMVAYNQNGFIKSNYRKFN